MMYTQMEIDLEVIAENYKKVSDTLPEETGIIAVVKADAYGLGAVPIAKKLEKAGCPMFAVTFIEEAVTLREAGVIAPILVMMPVESRELQITREHKLIITVTDYEMAKKISDELVRQSYSLPVHLKVDCGLSRMGIVLKDRVEEAAEEVEKIHALPNLNTEAVFSHLTAAGTEGAYAALDLTEQQRFFELTGRLKQRNICIKTHLMSSDPYTWYPQMPGDYIRVGSILYGISPKQYSGCGIRNCMSMNTYIVQIKWIPKDTEVSYGPLYKTARRTRIAVVPVGFADGIRRALSNKGEMLVRGKRVPIIGKICCDHTILDVTDIEDVKVGDEVTIFGKNGEVSQIAGDYAMLCNASAPETTVIFSSRIPRKYINI
ncbi:MAG: alanine racemase [Clostridia bacterium]|nr:alanine racemase [Clostridia bacterium]